ncbi:hypothetical protein K470DRAFT_258370 [Piedraia hortae CBS 480.64]|uniref:HDA1 complex subunit n=1 Tax=Piedraia hortae CBS 480.64 TaxID=1314780 RepID=A0A6A7BZV1_9PEZI|nr:hypothetical protein K470DRAFT_258370 [Piedraia hortae CBS 480.64]
MQNSHCPKLELSFLDEHRQRSPSAIPVEEPVRALSPIDTTQTDYQETLIPQAQTTPIQGTGPYMTSESVPQTPDLGSLQPHITTYPIALLGHQRDHYNTTVWQHRRLIQTFLGEAAPNDEVISNVKEFLERMRLITLHMDLDNSEAQQPRFQVEPKSQALWDAECSSKFRLLADLVNKLRDQEVQIGIMVHHGSLISMLQTLLQGLDVPCRYASEQSKQSTSGLAITLMLSSDFPAQLSKSKMGLLILLDPLAEREAEDSLTKLKGLPVVRLVIPNSIEHVDLSVSPSLPMLDRLRAQVIGTWQYRGEAGKSSSGAITPEAASTRIARYLTSNDEEMDLPINDITVLSIMANLPEDSLPNNTPAASSHKRPLDEATDPSADDHKKPRLEGTVSPNSISISSNTRVLGRTHPSNGCKLACTVALKTLEERLNEHIVALNDLQYRYEDQRYDIARIGRARDDALVLAQSATERLTHLNAKATALKLENVDLKDALSTAQAELLNHTIPERGELASLQQNLASVTVEREALAKRLETAKEEAQYLRETYQNASQQARSLADQVMTLEKQLNEANKMLGRERIVLRQLDIETETKSIKTDNITLKAMLQNREMLLVKREEEIARLKEVTRGRMSTRGTTASVSRSPKARTKRGSPAPGEALLHPLRHV